MLVFETQGINVDNSETSEREKIMKLIPEKKLRVETLGISPTGFWRLKKAGDLPVPIVIGRRNFYTIESITEWLANKKSTTSHNVSA